MLYTQDNVPRSPELDSKLKNLLYHDPEDDEWSDEENDKSKNGTSMASRAQILIDYVRKEKKLSYTGAYKYLKAKPEMLKQANISEKLFEKYDLSKVRGRDSYKKMLFMRLMDRCEYGIQFRSMLQEITGKMKETAMTTELVNNPVSEMVILFIIEHMKYELEVCRGKYGSKDDKSKLLKSENRI